MINCINVKETSPGLKLAISTGCKNLQSPIDIKRLNGAIFTSQRCDLHLTNGSNKSASSWTDIVQFVGGAQGIRWYLLCPRHNNQEKQPWSVHILIYSHIIYHSYSMKFYDLQLNIILVYYDIRLIYIYIQSLYIILLYPNNIKHDPKSRLRKTKTIITGFSCDGHLLRQETLDLKSRHPSGLRAARLV